MSTATLSLTDRQKREKDYYEKYVSQFNPDQKIDFSPVSGKERRPWNTYWAVYHFAEELFKPKAIMLDFGSGPGENALRFAHLGYRVEGFDIAESNVKVSRELFSRYGYQDRGHFQVGMAEELAYPDEHFDFIAGIDILHHVDIDRSIQECKRVLKPGGIAIFREPLEVPILDFIRNTWLVRLFAPKDKSFDLHITEDERKLNSKDIAIISKTFPEMEIRRYFLFARFDKFYRQGSDPRPSILEKLDFALIRTFPLLKYFGGVGIFILRK